MFNNDSGPNVLKDSWLIVMIIMSNNNFSCLSYVCRPYSVLLPLSCLKFLAKLKMKLLNYKYMYCVALIKTQHILASVKLTNRNFALFL